MRPYGSDSPLGRMRCAPTDPIRRRAHAVRRNGSGERAANGDGRAGGRNWAPGGYASNASTSNSRHDAVSAMPARRSIRIRTWDYTSAAVYFVTLNTYQRRHLFGIVDNARVMHSDFGRVAVEEWLRAETMRPEVALDAFVVMPDHVHGLIVLLPEGIVRDDVLEVVGYDLSVHSPEPEFVGRGRRRERGSLGSVVAGFKSAVTSRINLLRQMPDGRVWQRNYWERIVRNQHEWEAYRAYIEDNPRRWWERYGGTSPVGRHL
jgi:putative transposase